MESHHFQLKLEWNVTQKGMILDICLREADGFHLVNKMFLVIRSSSSKEKFMEMMFKCSFRNFYRTLQSTLLAWWSTNSSQSLRNINQTFLNQMKPWLSVIQVVEHFTPRSGALAKLVTHITSGHIAQLVLDLTHSYQANKNWKSWKCSLCSYVQHSHFGVSFDW